MKRDAMKLAKILNDKNAVNNLTDMIPHAFPNVGRESAVKIANIFASKKHLDSLISSQAEIFDKNFTGLELSNLVKFFSSETGTKWRSKMISIFEELNAVGKVWGEKVAEQEQQTFFEILSEDKNMIEKTQKEAEEKINSHNSVFAKRMEFAKQYCAIKNWDMNDLKVEQIMEIRKQDGWIMNGGE